MLLPLRATSLPAVHALALRLALELRLAPGKEFCEHLGVKVELRRLLISPNPQRVGVIGLVEFGFYGFDLIFLNEKKGCIQFLRQIFVLVIADVHKITQDPGQGISTGSWVIL